MSGASEAKRRYVGSYDDIPIADDDILSLKQLIDDKWTYFLIEMDKYNLLRDGRNDDAMVEKMGYVFADEFEFRAYNTDGSEFGESQGRYTARSWLEKQNVHSWKLVKGTMSVPNFAHVMHVLERGKRLKLEGYHLHIFVGADIRLAAGAARHLAFETLIFEKLAQGWRIVEYSETVANTSTFMPKPNLPGAPMPDF